ncbi:hypothetical protein LJC27_05200 [Christensenellaceae bacterium OttesenSCG-928-M15]|nr:hypothetical protein [Christensenellaceae bacterium OttesenSCG-928-M15]
MGYKNGPPTKVVGEAVLSWGGGDAVKRTSFRACVEARDVVLVATKEVM